MRIAVSLLALITGAGAFAGDLNECSPGLCQLTAAGTLQDLRWPDFHDLQPNLDRLYKFTGYTPVWVRNGSAAPLALQVIQVFKNAGLEGLNPEDYDGSRWDERLASLPAGTFPPERFDLALTVSAMRYALDLRFGRANPKGRPDDGLLLDIWVLQRLLPTSDAAATFRELDPPFPGYARLRDKLAQYRTLAQEDNGERLPSGARPVEPGQPYSGAGRLTDLLRRVGDLPADASTDSDKYQGPLVDAVKRYQARHGIDVDGRLGASTLAALNTPLDRRVRQIELAMERYRWIPRESSRPSIVVNIPEFKLRAFASDGRSELEMKVVTGKAKLLQTPVFGSDMKFVIFRPYWNVPSSIQRKEILPQLGRDRSYLAKNEYQVVTPGGKVVSDGTVSDEILSGLRNGRYEVRQKPGPKNSLGNIKFVLPNENDIYLHDTPARSLFSRSRRDFSHGCIRVERPLDLAIWVLRDRPEWTRDKIMDAMNGSDPLRVDLPSSIPVSIVYWSAVTSDDGSIYFFDDVYGLDETLDRQITTGGYGPRPRG
jgi:murein L,D-transpeptidase YcbB/YkuD